MIIPSVLCAGLPAVHDCGIFQAIGVIDELAPKMCSFSF